MFSKVFYSMSNSYLNSIAYSVEFSYSFLHDYLVSHIFFMFCEFTRSQLSSVSSKLILGFGLKGH